MYADPDCTVPYFGTEEIDSGSTVYCKLICNDGFFCSRLIFNSGAADSETFVMPEGELDLSTSIFRYGDANSDGNEVTAAELLTEFDEEFFETHDLIPVFALGQKISIGSVSRGIGNPALELVLGESVPNGLGFTFTVISKGSSADAILKIDGVTVDQFFGSIPAGN